MIYSPTWESLREHGVPRWFENAKFGIFIHWGIYSVPAWAPTTGELGAVPREEWFKNNPYAEWYLNSLRTKGSPTWKYHIEKYGEKFDYYDFIDMWKAEKWDPKKWAELFKKSGAQYVIPTTKHHDGFCLWPSKYTDFNSAEKGPKRDLIGELSKAVKDKGMRFGVYYSGALDWRFTNAPIERSEDMRGLIRPHTYAYADYAYNQFMELVERYSPDILWNDIGWPEKGREDLKYLFAYFYNRNPSGVVNDRWEIPHWDFHTPEYKQNYPDGIPSYKWELCRGLGYSFGYNRNEGEEEVLRDKELVRLLVEVVSKGGNLLLNVGPKADGTIPKIQEKRLLSLGKWLEKNGEAIYDTRPWKMDKTQTYDGKEIRFTVGKDAFYVIMFNVTHERNTIKSLELREETKIRTLRGDTVPFKSKGDDVEITVPLSDDEIVVLKVSPIP